MTEFLLIFGGVSIAFVAVNGYFLYCNSQRIDRLSRSRGSDALG